MAECAKRPTQADIRVQPDLFPMLPCIRLKRHRGDHENSAGQKWGQSGSRGETSAHGMRAVGEDQQIDTDVVTGIMAERVWAEVEKHPYSPVFFCQCDRVEDSQASNDCFRQEIEPQAVLDNWHPHHIEKRRKGPKANRRNVFRSRSRPDNIAIVSPECHRRIERNAPEFSGSQP
jgi:hypothetical protein